MKRITKIALFVVSLAVLASLVGVVPGFRPLARLEAAVQAATDDLLTFDVACDCRTFAGPGVGPTASRGDVFIVNGKIFPAGTLPSGTASNDPTLPVNGVSSIGEWICRGQIAGAFPPAIVPAYSSTPFAFNTQYFIPKDGGALTAEGYELPGSGPLSVTGGIGRFSGAAGDIHVTVLGTNATQCPNFRAKFNLHPGS